MGCTKNGCSKAECMPCRLNQMAHGWLQRRAPDQRKLERAQASASFYKALASEYEKLHVLVSDTALMLYKGQTEKAPSDSNATIWPANIPFYFRPSERQPYLNYVGGTDPDNPTSIGLLTVGVVED